MSILKLKDSQGNWIGVPTIKGDKGDNGNGISSAVLNNDYTLTLTFTDGTTYTTPSIRGEKGEQGEPATDMDIHICSSNEYDSETRIPTITSPDDKTFYLVPTVDGTSPDLFAEWVYVNNAWEMFGSASVDLSGYLTDVTVNGTSIVNEGVAEIPIASNTELGVVKANESYGYRIVNGFIRTKIPSANHLKIGANTDNPLTTAVQHTATFYGLAKVAGHDEKDSTLPVGQYTDEAKASIQSMLGVPSEDEVVTDVQINGQSIVSDGVANVPVATLSQIGAFRTTNYKGFAVDGNGYIALDWANNSQIKGGAHSYKALSAANQHTATFYGLAKAAGDTTQSQSSNAVGTYTEDAKSKISEMLNGSVSVSGTTPTITAKSGIRYVCGEVATLDFTPSATGICDVVFTSGATATVLTITGTVKWANGFDPTSLDANATYELNIMDGLGVCCAWT